MIGITLAAIPGSYLWSATPGGYSEAGRAQFAAMPGIHWDRKERYYTGAPEALLPVCKTLEAAGVAKIRRDHSLPMLADSDFAQAFAEARAAVNAPSHTTLREYQTIGAAWICHMLQHTGGAILADEMGIGKSAQALAACSALGLAPLIVCPASVRGHWRGQLARWAPELAAAMPLPPFSYADFTYAAPGGWLDAPRVQALIVDELHYAADPIGSSKRAKALREWRARNPSTPVIGLTGTPVPARVRDLYVPLDLCHPGRWGSKSAFQKRYCGGHTEEHPRDPELSIWVADGASNQAELAERLKAVMLRRTKAEVALELPARTRIIQEIELPAAARKCLQLATAAISWDGRARDGVSELLAAAEPYKIEAAVSLAQDAIASGSKPLVLCLRRDTAEMIACALGCPVADGRLEASKRIPLLQAATAATSTIAAVTTGVDLVNFDTVIFVGLDWVPATILQAEARVHRIGQGLPVTVYFIVALGSLDEIVRGRVLDRLDQWADLGLGESSGAAEDLRGGSDEQLLADLVKAAIGS